MQTGKEALLAAYRGEMPEFIFTRADVRDIFMDEVEQYGRDTYKRAFYC